MEDVRCHQSLSYSKISYLRIMSFCWWDNGCWLFALAK